jgi:rare lipoprotein A
MRGKRLVAAVVLALVPAGAFAPRALSSPASDLTTARARAAAARADLTVLLVQYRDAALRADDAAAESLRLRVLVEQARAAELDAQSSFDDRVTQIYIAGPNALTEVILGLRDLADVEAALPYARHSLSIGRAEVRALTSRHAATASLARQADAAEQTAIEDQLRLDIVKDEIARRVAKAERDVQTATVAAARAAAKKSLFTIEHAVANWRELIDHALQDKRHARGEAAFAAAAPYLGPRADCSIPKGLHRTGEELSGEASWYGAGFAGRSTASGAVYDPRRYTVAHKTLPLGLFLLIKSDGRCVVSFLNDRGPYVEPRILDLSWYSAEAVDLSGVEHVDATVLVRD